MSRTKMNRKKQVKRAIMASRTKRAARVRWARRSAARWRALRGEAADAGMSTAEYAVGTVAACAFGAPMLGCGRSFRVSTAPGWSRELGIWLPGKGVLVTTPFAPRTRARGS